jgi:hypothetical protein
MLLITFGTTNVSAHMRIFYGQAFEALFNRHDRIKGDFVRKRHCNLAIDQFSKVFSVISALSYLENNQSFTETELVACIRDASEFYKIELDPESFLTDLTRSVCLISKDGLLLTFSHRSFQEYFTALFLVQDRLIQKYDYFQKIVHRAFHDSVICLAFEMNRNVLETEWFFEVGRQIEKLSQTIRGWPPSNPALIFNAFYSRMRIDIRRPSISMETENHFKLGPAIRVALAMYPERPILQTRITVSESELTADVDKIEAFRQEFTHDRGRFASEPSSSQTEFIKAEGVYYWTCADASRDILINLNSFRAFVKDIDLYLRLMGELQAENENSGRRFVLRHKELIA